ncbi:MAG: Stk1 family PASTA domain-containing Ser/Thr kinase, partial [Actinobacteria bacterium]|nr:Stk1 family PASTA domain-containing Ser/Thr kinase [Actinomycetota bacterium]
MTNSNIPLVNDRYRVERSIGRGGMAEVFLAHDLLLDRPVALKVLFPEYAIDPTFVERFRREAQSAAALTHPNIVAVYDWGKVNATYFIAMEYVEGKTLATILKERGRLSPIHTCDVIAEVASALSFANENGVVHRDIKPGNILIGTSGQVKVADFGIARALGTGVDEALTEIGSVMGTATYLSPEQAQGAQPDPRSDIYSLGVMMYELVAGKAPFVGESAVAIAYQHVHNIPTPLRDLVADLPRGFESVVAKCMAKNAARRYENAALVREDIRRIIDGTETLALNEARGVAKEIALSDTAEIPVVVLPPYEEVSTEFTSVDPKKPAMVIGGTVIALVLLAVIIFVFRTVGGSSNTLPSVVNLSIDAAQEQLAALGLTVVLNELPQDGVAPGVVYDQSPAAGTSFEIGDAITLTYTPRAGSMMVPPIQGLLYDAAVAQATAVGLTIEITEERVDPTTPIGQIISQDPAATVLLPPGSPIRVVVSKGGPSVAIPNVEGQASDAAQQVLIGAPFLFSVTLAEEQSTSVPKGRVIRTEPPIRTSVASGSSVTVVISGGGNQSTVPDVTGQSEADAKTLLNNAGLVWEVRYQNVPAG